MGTIAKGARCYGATGVLAVALWERGQGGDRGGRSRLGMLDMGSMSNTTRYGVLIDGRRGGYGVVFPDLPGCY